MCTSHIVMYVADGHVNWPVLIVTGGNRHSSLVTAENNWAEYRAVCLGILRDYVLKASGVSFKSK